MITEFQEFFYSGYQSLVMVCSQSVSSLRIFSLYAVGAFLCKSAGFLVGFCVCCEVRFEVCCSVIFFPVSVSHLFQLDVPLCHLDLHPTPVNHLGTCGKSSLTCVLFGPSALGPLMFVIELGVFVWLTEHAWVISTQV